ncbi:nitroreductase family protein [Rhodobacteraceae bacterium XHP0102]|nr:nitroreductase family protein [Rhodobacteraceae bacterium XHP0102]
MTVFYADYDLDRQDSVPFDNGFLKPGELVKNPNPEMPLIDSIYTRRTSRAYADKMVSRELFQWIVSVAMNAPTACNEQQWKIVHIENRDTINDLYERGSAAFLKNVKQCFLICYNSRNDNPYWYDYIQSASAFAAFFQVVAHTVGIGSCWVGHLPNRSELKRIFKIHRHYEPVCLISYGYYRGKAKTLPRKHDASSIIMEEKFDSNDLVFASHRKRRVRLVLRYLYYKVPPVLRKKLRRYSIKFEKKFYYEKFD